MLRKVAQPGYGHTRERELIDKALEIVENRYSEELTAGIVAHELNISSQYFCNIFKKLTGKTFTNYLNYMRIVESLPALNSGNYKMRDIAINFGFSDENYYSRIFKRIMFVSPRQYLQNKIEQVVSV